jgi:hypothetical protein
MLVPSVVYARCHKSVILSGIMVGVVMLNAVVPYLHRQSVIAKIPASETMDVLALAPWGFAATNKIYVAVLPKQPGQVRHCYCLHHF